MSKQTKRKRTTPITLDEQINLNISLALKQAEKELAAGTASSQIVTLFAKMSAKREEVELEKARLEMRLLEKKIESTAAATELLSLRDDVLNAIQRYTVGDDYEDR